MQVSHDALVKKVAVSESNPGYTAPHDGLAMNFEQKRRLSIAIGQLPGDRISEVMRIIAEDESMQARVIFTLQQIYSIPFPIHTFKKISHSLAIAFGYAPYDDWNWLKCSIYW